jgi:nucleotide-binding universal stress UspA family protein
MASRPILVGAGGSEQSLCAVNWAAREAALRSVPLRSVSVIPARPGTRWSTAHGAHPATHGPVAIVPEEFRPGPGTV